MTIRKIILLLLLVMSTMNNECKAWQPKPYKIYLIDLQCQQDSVIPSSVMALQNRPKRKVDTKNFQCGGLIGWLLHFLLWNKCGGTII